MNSEKLWTKKFILITLSGFFSAMVFYVFLTTMAMYSTVTYETDASISGLVASIFVFGSVVGRIFTGRYLEHIGRKRMALIGNILFFAMGFAYLIPMGILPFMAIRTIHGIAFGIVNNTLTTVVVHFIPQKRIGEGIGYYSLNFVLATAIGPFVGLFMVQAFSYNVLFWSCILLSSAALVFVSIVEIKDPDFTREEKLDIKRNGGIKDFFDKRALPMAVLIFIMGICYTSVTTFLDSFATKLNMSFIAPLFFVTYGVFILIIRPLAGKLLDRKGDNVVMIPAILSFAVSLFLLSISDTVILFLLSAFFMAVGFGNILNIGQTIATKSVPPHRVGVATSTYFVFNDFGYGLGPVIMGFFVTWQGYSFMYMTEAMIVAISLIFYYLVHGRHVGFKPTQLVTDK